MEKRKLFYLASPYSCKEEDASKERIDQVHTERFDAVQKAAVDLTVDHGIYVFSPIAYNHPMVRFNLPTDWLFWQEYDKAFIDHCDGLVVLQLDGFDVSDGVIAEAKYAESLGLPVVYLTVEQIELGEVDVLKELL